MLPFCDIIYCHYFKATSSYFFGLLIFFLLFSHTHMSLMAFNHCFFLFAFFFKINSARCFSVCLEKSWMARFFFILYQEMCVTTISNSKWYNRIQRCWKSFLSGDRLWWQQLLSFIVIFYREKAVSIQRQWYFHFFLKLCMIYRQILFVLNNPYTMSFVNNKNDHYNLNMLKRT